MSRSIIAAGMLASASLLMWSQSATATVNVQCPGDRDGDAVIDRVDSAHPNAKCMHITAGDGFIRSADGKDQYIFGFNNVTGISEDDVMSAGRLAANFSAPSIILDEGDEFFLTISNVPFAARPDLFDAHTVHWHGYPNAAVVFDGEPEGSFGVNPGSSFTYFYRVGTPGTFMYHCHQEATEHMQMGMLGNLYVRPAQNRLPGGTSLGNHTHLDGHKYVYNDGDGSTRYDVEYPIQLAGFDSAFHTASVSTQPLPFALMRDNYPMINGRGYPDTVNPQPVLNADGKPSQPLSALVKATQGQRILLRMSSLDVTRYFTVTAGGLPMRVVGRGAAILRGGGAAAGKNVAYTTASVTLGGGEAVDVIIDTTGVPRGTYPLHAANLHYLANGDQDMGGMMTEIVVE